MICANLTHLLGIACMPLDEAGRIALIETPFRFADGEAMPLFVEMVGDNHLRFFDDGLTVWHLRGRGVALGDARKAKFLKAIAEAHSVQLDDELCFEVASGPQDAPEAFQRLQRALLAVAAWEQEHENSDVDTALLLDEVAQALTLANPAVLVERDVELVGITKVPMRFDLRQGGEYVLAIGPRAQSASGAIRKLLDVRNLPANAALSFRVVIDDRKDKASADREGLVVSTVATVELLSALQARAGEAASGSRVVH